MKKDAPKSTSELLLAVEAAIGKDSVNGMANALEISRPAVRNLYAGGIMSDTTALTACNLAKINPADVLPYIALERAKRNESPETVLIWEQIIRESSTKVAAVTLCLLSSFSYINLESTPIFL